MGMDVNSEEAADWSKLMEENSRLEHECARLEHECLRLEDHINDADDENIRLRAEVERLQEHKRRQAEDIMTLGQMVGRCCPICAALATDGKGE